MKVEIIRIKENKGRHLTRPSLMDLQRDQRLRLWSYVAGGVTRLSSCDVMHRRHSDVCDVPRGCSDATTSCITLHNQANTPRCFSRCEAVCSVSPKFSGSQIGGFPSARTRPMCAHAIDAHDDHALQEGSRSTGGLHGEP